jgi:hypothetical protein
MRNAYTILVGKFERKRPLRSPSSRWEENIKTDLKYMGCEGVDRIQSV